MATTSYGTPYVQSSDLVSGWPNASLNVANRIDQVSYAGNGINAQTVTSYTLAVTDAGKLVTLNNAAAVAVSLPQDSTANLPVGSVTRIYNLGAGVVTVQAGAGATLQGGSVTVAQYDACNVTKLSANTYGIAAKAPGLQLVTAQSFSAVSSVSVNNCFSTTYDNYRMVIDAIPASGTVDMNIRLRASGTDNTSNQYSNGRVYVGAIYSQALSSTNVGLTNVFYCSQGENVGSAVVDVYGPYLSQRTQITYLATGSLFFVGGGQMTVTTQYDGITWSFSGNMTGSLRIYGYRNS